jgi:hypothetical protein
MSVRPVLRLAVVVTVVAVAIVGVFLLALYVSGSPWADSMTVSNQVRQSTSCSSVPQPSSVGFGSATLAAAWILGLQEGIHAGWLKQLRDGRELGNGPEVKGWLEYARQQEEKSDAAAIRLAQALKVGRPAAYAPSSRSKALDEFTTFVEQLGQPSAHGLATNYGALACEVYKLAAYWGFSTIYSAAAPDKRNVYAPEIVHYAKRVDLPDDLTRAMTDASGKGRNTAEVQADAEQVSKKVAEYWRKR